MSVTVWVLNKHVLFTMHYYWQSMFSTVGKPPQYTGTEFTAFFSSNSVNELNKCKTVQRKHRYAQQTNKCKIRKKLLTRTMADSWEITWGLGSINCLSDSQRCLQLNRNPRQTKSCSPTSTTGINTHRFTSDQQYLSFCQQTSHN